MKYSHVGIVQSLEEIYNLLVGREVLLLGDIVDIRGSDVIRWRPQQRDKRDHNTVETKYPTPSQLGAHRFNPSLHTARMLLATNPQQTYLVSVSDAFGGFIQREHEAADELSSPRYSKMMQVNNG